MNFHQLLQQRDTLLRQARLANVAFALHRLHLFTARIARAGLRGDVTLSLTDPDTDRRWPVLTAHTANQSVLEEHFTDEDIIELADVLTFADITTGSTEFTFRIDELEALAGPRLRQELAAAGVITPANPRLQEDSRQDRR